MTETPCLEDVVAQLDALINEERDALLNGEFDAIGEISVRKEQLIESLMSLSPGDANSIRPLQVKLRRNQDLYDHALAGIRIVAERLGTMRKLRKSMDTYDSSGRKTTIEAGAEGRLERRA